MTQLEKLEACVQEKITYWQKHPGFKDIERVSAIIALEDVLRKIAELKEEDER